MIDWAVVSQRILQYQKATLAKGKVYPMLYSINKKHVVNWRVIEDSKKQFKPFHGNNGSANFVLITYQYLYFYSICNGSSCPISPSPTSIE